MSDLLKIKRLVDGDDIFNWRVEAACWNVGIDFDRRVLTTVASQDDILAGAVINEADTIISDGITDEAIVAAVNKYKTEVLNIGSV